MQVLQNKNSVWQNPRDTNSPMIEFAEVGKGHEFEPDTTIRPPATGVVITREDATCIKAFTPLEFTINTSEPAQCKIDYNLTTGFDEMSFFVGGNSLLVYNHTEILSLPGPTTINEIAPEIQNDGTYTLYVRCRDANGNFNQDPFSVRFCVEPGPDTTPPQIVTTNVPNENPIQFNQTTLDLEVYINEPAECRWSREIDKSYENMENNMDCDLLVWQMNNKNTYTCRTTLTGIEDRKENEYYFKCKDQPHLIGTEKEADRNTNVESYEYTLIGTQPLNILDIEPFDETISAATDVIPVLLKVTTDNGYMNGEALCYYFIGEAPENDEGYILFSETGETNVHTQRQDLPEGDYTYAIKCVDLGGNAAYNETNFIVDTDKQGPMIIRVYKESGSLKIITSEDSECSFSISDCNFEIDDGIQMSSLDFRVHTYDWNINQNYYLRCKDQYNNQPNPNTCSLIVRSSELEDPEED